MAALAPALGNSLTYLSTLLCSQFFILFFGINYCASQGKEPYVALRFEYRIA
jgi:hypothetical protein